MYSPGAALVYIYKVFFGAHIVLYIRVMMSQVDEFLAHYDLTLRHLQVVFFVANVYARHRVQNV